MESEKNCLNVVVVGSGTMGTALSHLTASAGNACTLLTEDKLVAETVNTRHCHPVFFKGLTLHSKVKAAGEFDKHIPDADLLIMAAPSYNMRDTARRIKHLTHADQSVLSATKGFEPETCKLMSEVLRQELRNDHIGTLSGPNMTPDLLMNLPTKLIVSSASQQMRNHGRMAFSSPAVDISASEDIRSFEYVSALKNIVAIEVGIVTGLKLGDNFRALIFAEGMAEISGLMKKMGLNAEVFYGLAGLSDIFLTCSSPFAKNYTVGLQLGLGAALSDLLQDLKAKGEVAEGLESLKAGHSLAQQFGCEVPLLDAAYSFVYQKAGGKRARGFWAKDER